MSDCGVCLYGGDECCDVWNVSWPIAAKEHKCTECYRPIPKGAKHQLVKMLYEGGWSAERTCAVCAEIRKAFYCDGEMIGEFWNQMSDVFGELKTSCFDRLTTPEAKAYLRQRWMEWKGI